MTKLFTSLFIALFCSSCLIPDHGQAVDRTSGDSQPCVTLTGADSHVTERGYHRIMSTEEWVRVWQKHKGEKQDGEYNFHYNPLGLPVVDFERYMVVGIFEGSSWNSAGLTTVSIDEEKTRIVFRFDSKSYQTTGPDGGGQKVTVYGFFVIPRSTKRLVLEESAQRRKDQPPAWKERVAFPGL